MANDQVRYKQTREQEGGEAGVLMYLEKPVARQTSARRLHEEAG